MNSLSLPYPNMTLYLYELKSNIQYKDKERENKNQLFYHKSLSISISSRISMHLSSSGKCKANMDTGSSHNILQPLISDSFKACTSRDWFGTLAHWCGLRHCTFNLGGNWKQYGTQILLHHHHKHTYFKNNI